MSEENSKIRSSETKDRYSAIAAAVFFLLSRWCPEVHYFPLDLLSSTIKPNKCNLRVMLLKVSRSLFSLFQPRSQGLSSYHPLGQARRDPGWVWSLATLTIVNIREGPSVTRQFVTLSFVALRLPLPTMFNGSLRAESSNSIYSTIYVKVRQVCLKAIYRGRDVVTVVPIGFEESRSYFNFGHRSSSARMIVINCCFSFEV